MRSIRPDGALIQFLTNREDVSKSLINLIVNDRKSITMEIAETWKDLALVIEFLFMPPAV
jgi:hypothetical protein